VTTREKVESLLRRLCAAQEDAAVSQIEFNHDISDVSLSQVQERRERLPRVFDATVHKLMALIGGR
jgi:hypothetical protein